MPDEYMPYLISWNTTRRCNLRCGHCYLDSTELRSGSGGELTTSEGIALLDEIAEYASGAMLVLSGGEPLLREDVYQLAEHASASGLSVVVGTNGTLLDAYAARKLVESGVRGVGISLDSLKAERHDSFRGVRGAWEKTVQGIEECRKSGLDFQLQTTATRANYREIPALIEFAYEMGARVFNLFFLVCTGRGEKMTDLSPQQYHDLLRYLAQNQGYGDMMVRARCAPHFARFMHEHTNKLPLIRGCLAGINYCRVAPDGGVTPCPYLPVTLGNVREASFREIWEGSDVLRELRAGKPGGKCGACFYASVCGGCRAKAYAATGDYLGEDPWCTYQPTKKRAPRDLAFEDVIWADEARHRLERVPPFIRGAVVKLVERYAAENGHREITPEVLAEARRFWRGSGIRR
jgi:radical SAM protein with 4Fe4S-binding SPASM domain